MSVLLVEPRPYLIEGGAPIDFDILSGFHLRYSGHGKQTVEWSASEAWRRSFHD